MGKMDPRELSASVTQAVKKAAQPVVSSAKPVADVEALPATSVKKSPATMEETRSPQTAPPQEQSSLRVDCAPYPSRRGAQLRTFLRSVSEYDPYRRPRTSTVQLLRPATRTRSKAQPSSPVITATQPPPPPPPPPAPAPTYTSQFPDCPARLARLPKPYPRVPLPSTRILPSDLRTIHLAQPTQTSTRAAQSTQPSSRRSTLAASQAHPAQPASATLTPIHTAAEEVPPVPDPSHFYIFLSFIILLASIPTLPTLLSTLIWHTSGLLSSLVLVVPVLLRIVASTPLDILLVVVLVLVPIMLSLLQRIRLQTVLLLSYVAAVAGTAYRTF